MRAPLARHGANKLAAAVVSPNGREGADIVSRVVRLFCLGAIGSEELLDESFYYGFTTRTTSQLFQLYVVLLLVIISERECLVEGDRACNSDEKPIPVGDRSREGIPLLRQ